MICRLAEGAAGTRGLCTVLGIVDVHRGGGRVLGKETSVKLWSTVVVAVAALIVAVCVVALALLGGGLPTWATIMLLLVGFAVTFGALGALVRALSTDG